ncbi:uncharacterized protein GIQ15_06169 [Arthroderma uncinatum]|uniref:uncharacterized protein n=1 Tax=Arthroderma uncinatum TaxID=74035 RepID=UPI00144AB7C2|nr:uncharacterized protein GIQ15_06169 [Arthroderma uncinatum]KAF3480822.1 hypothetical protein GIQ15_06169 [Arthroderma uncinatum]
MKPVEICANPETLPFLANRARVSITQEDEVEQRWMALRMEQTRQMKQTKQMKEDTVEMSSSANNRDSKGIVELLTPAPIFGSRA